VREFYYCPFPINFASETGAFPFNPIKSFPDAFPVWVGVKVTFTMQLAPAARNAPQLLFATNTGELVVICWIVNLLLAAFANVTGNVLFWPTATPPKFNWMGNTTID
jgi:hypothetical protein